MTTQTYQKLINEGIKGLPPDTLAEIVDFIYFIRKRTMHPETFEEELQSILLNTELHQLSREEVTTIHKNCDF